MTWEAVLYGFSLVGSLVAVALFVSAHRRNRRVRQQREEWERRSF